jgi:dephospho-CoA kinase
MIIGITGTDGAGKGTVVDYLLHNKEFSHFSASGFIAKEVTSLGLPLSRNQLRLTGNELRLKYGNDVTVTTAFKEIEERGALNVVIESIRAVAEAVTLKSRGGILLAVDADSAVRYKRVQERRSSKDQVTYEQFLEHEELEKNDPDPHGMQKGKVMEMADYTIFNDGTLVELETKVEEFLKQYGN